MNSRLCMTTHFFQDKPVAQLLGDEVTAENLNDDCLGRCLDKIADYGVTQLYAEIAKEKDILGKRMHLDTTNFSLYGEYDSVECLGDSPMSTYGYSKANRPDLKQVTLSLIQSGAANIPALRQLCRSQKPCGTRVAQQYLFMLCRGLAAHLA